MFGKSESIENWEQILNHSKERKKFSWDCGSNLVKLQWEHHLENVKNSELWKPRESKVRQIKLNVNYRRNQVKQESLKNRQETKDG